LVSRQPTLGAQPDTAGLLAARGRFHFFNLLQMSSTVPAHPLDESATVISRCSSG